MYNSEQHTLFICDYCDRKFKTKTTIRRHLVRKHTPCNEEQTYTKFKIEFKNKDKFMKHTQNMHKPKRVDKKIREYVCYACQINFTQLRYLKYHIREFHFNLLTKVPYSHFKKVNQVWFENVINSTNIVEMKKVGENMILMRKLNDNTAMKVGEQPTKILDLRDTYPTHRVPTAQCEICLKLYDKFYINKHKADVHSITPYIAPYL